MSKGKGDQPVHTPENPYCGDASHSCHNDWEYHEEVTDVLNGDSEIDEEQAQFALDFLSIAS